VVTVRPSIAPDDRLPPLRDLLAEIADPGRPVLLDLEDNPTVRATAARWRSTVTVHTG
jgi:hypothetical protein